jgi:hypothetical protein
MLYDAVLNNFVVKNYAGSASTEIGNERFGQRESQNYRGRLGKEFNAWVSSGSTDKASETLRDVYQSFLNDTPENPGLAHQNYIDWVKLHSREIMKNPALRGVSKEQLITQIAAIGNTTAPVINDAQKEYLALLVQGYRGANKTSRHDGSNPLTRGNRGVDSGRGGRGDSGRSSGR